MDSLNITIERWLALATESELRDELEHLIQSNDTDGLQDRFCRQLAFGTGGLRAVIGIGPNRMNIYTVRKATQGLAAHLLNGNERPSAAIAYDSRIKSDLFATETARVLAANGIQVYLFPRLMPTPVLSFAVRRLKCRCGICITASHNPAQYNGYKVYGSDGCQITDHDAQAIQQEIDNVDPFNDVRIVDFSEAQADGSIRYIKEDVPDAFLQSVLECRMLNEPADNLRVVYSPLNGSGRECVMSALEGIGVQELHVVSSQSEPDGCFPTCPFPNPEEASALTEGLDLARRMDADILLATDPDCDRVGVAVLHQGQYRILTGNEVGVLLLEHIAQMRLSHNAMPRSSVAVKTIVTTDMAKHICKKYGIELRDTLTGFKYIGEQIGRLEQTSDEGRFIFGFEESCGYLAGTYARDKDAVSACVLLCELAAHLKRQNKTLVTALTALYEEYGWYGSALLSVNLPGENGLKTMERVMHSLRDSNKTIAGYPVERRVDYASQDISENPGSDVLLPKADVLEFFLQDRRRVILRPSGTEPKMKIYLSVCTASETDTQRQLAELSRRCDDWFRALTA